MRRANAGLKWDPVRIVHVLALFNGSHVLEDFEKLERLLDKTAFELLTNKTYGLGYWEKGTDRDVWYGIGRANPGSGEQYPVLESIGEYCKIVSAAHLEIPAMNTDLNASTILKKWHKDPTTYLALP